MAAATELVRQTPEAPFSTSSGELLQSRVTEVGQPPTPNDPREALEWAESFASKAVRLDLVSPIGPRRPNVLWLGFHELIESPF